MRKPKVGQVLYSLNVGNAARGREQKLTPVVVKSVGRKYFVCGEEGCPKWMCTTYYLDTWTELSDYSPDSCLYESEKDYEDYKEINRLFNLIKRKYFDTFGPTSLSLEQLQKIEAILQDG